MGAKEIAASLIKPLYFKEAKKFIPELRLKDLGPKTAAGVRAQAWQRGGALLDDFAIDTVGNVTLIRNAPSPAATSAMSIADYVIANHIITHGKGKQ
jgi:L-2-hydroxyglutarate oxidase LhgO